MKTLLAVIAGLVSAFTCSAQSPNFELLNPTSPTLTNGTLITIKWVPPAGVMTVRLMLCPDANHGTFITESTTNSGEYTWTVSRGVYDSTYYTNFHVRIDGCTTNHWCGAGDGPQFTLVNPTVTPAVITKLEKLWEDEFWSYFQIDVVADSNAGSFLEYSEDMSLWLRITDSPTIPPDGNITWYVRTKYPTLFFRVITGN